MAVPNTNTFSFQDVTMEIYGDTATGRNLSQAFTDATGTLDQTYEGNHDRQTNFRNYSHIPNEIALYLDSMVISTPDYELNWSFEIWNGTVSDYNYVVRYQNITQGSSYYQLYSSTSYANTKSGVISGTVSTAISNYTGDSFSVELSIDGGSTWTGIVYYSKSAILDY